MDNYYHLVERQDEVNNFMSTITKKKINKNSTDSFQYYSVSSHELEFNLSYIDLTVHIL